MKKIKLTTNRGKSFDWFLNFYLNLWLWLNGIEDDVDKATTLIANQIRWINKIF